MKHPQRSAFALYQPPMAPTLRLGNAPADRVMLGSVPGIYPTTTAAQMAGQARP